MSEYQYYEWQAIDRILTLEEHAAVDGLSSHIEVTASQAWVEYSWSDFKHDPKQVLSKYFDAHLYLANWGSRRLIFRFPKGLLAEAAIEAYCVPYHISFEISGDYHVLDIELDEEEGVGWVDANGVLSTFTRLRDDLIQGDFRLLYLAWLKAISLDIYWDEDDEDEFEERPEPQVPAGLNNLSPALNLFAHLFDIDEFLIESAAEISPELESQPEIDYGSLIINLSRVECDQYLAKIANGDSGTTLALRKHLLSFIHKPPESTQEWRSIKHLFERREQLQQAEKQRQVEAAQQAHIANMEALAKREPQMWSKIDLLLESYTPKNYDEVTRMLVELKQLAEYQGTQEKFQSDLNALRERFKTRSSLMQRWNRQGL
ncbi:MAG: hypothetical protein ISR58_05395 [Anaerolineales bacterium]|nr:hypothetical protein [Anaerolineales bacterium]